MAENRFNSMLEKVIDRYSIENPRTSDEVMLAKIAAGEPVTEPAETRLQYWLRQIELQGDVPTTHDLEVSENGNFTPQEFGSQYFSSVKVAVPIPTLENKNISENGTFNADSGKAWNSVTVSVPPYITSTNLPLTTQIGDVVFVGVILGSGAITNMHINLYVRGETPATSYIVEHFGNFSLSGDVLSFSPNTGYNIIWTGFAQKYINIGGD